MIAILLVALVARPVTLAAVGDIMLARAETRKIAKYGPGKPLAGVRSIVRGADISVGNLECALSTAPFAVEKQITLRANPQLAACLKGFTLLSLVNNHAGDCGEAGLEETQGALHRNGITAAMPSSTTTLTVDGLRIGFLPLMDLPPAYIGEWRSLLATLRKNSDVVVVMIHWGVEKVSSESPRQRALAAQLASAGADVILGSHPHVLQPIRWLPGWRHRRCLVAYSLGNFIFDAPFGIQRDSEILRVRLTAAGVASFDTVPVRLNHGFPVASRRPGSSRLTRAPLASTRPDSPAISP